MFLSASNPSLSGVLFDPVQSLRAATRDLHQTLDRELPLARGDATLVDYRNHLLVLNAWQLALKPWLSVVLDNDWSQALMAQDLADIPGGASRLPTPSR